MSRKELHEKKERALLMDIKLQELFPGKKGTALFHSNPWELLVSVILSAQCTDERVNMVTKDLFSKYTKLEDYLDASLEEFQENIHSTGFYRNKAKNILASAQSVHLEFGGEVPNEMDKLLSLPGVARKTANVVLGNAFGIHEGIAVDTHVRRFSLRFDLSDSKQPEKIEKDLMELLPQDRWFEFGNNLIYYGREICGARPHECEIHPLTSIYPPAAEKWPKAK